MIRHSNAAPGANARASKKKYLGNYLGIVVQNNDPDKQGRIKVFVPHVSPSVYKNFVDQTTDLSFKFPGANINSALSPIMQQLKDILPWASCAAPLVGASGSGRYNAFLDQASISDSNKLATTKEDTTTPLTKYSLNKSGVGEKPAKKYEPQSLLVSDAFIDAPTAGSNRVNKYAQSYIPSSYSNQAKGTFAIPNVGSHVWIFFMEGNPMFPVYFAVAFGDEDWKGIFGITSTEDGVDYPGAYENKSSADVTSFNQNNETYRNKFVISQKGGVFEIVNTDNRELLKLTHYSGSFIELNNHTTTQLATGNDQKLVLADQFLTVRGYRNEYTEHDYDLIIKGDYYRKVGTLNVDAYNQWKAIVNDIAEAKQLFEMKRTAYFHDSIYIKKSAPGQTKSPKSTGGHAPCPVCTSPYRGKYWNTAYILKAIGNNEKCDIFIGRNEASFFTGFSPKFISTIPSYVQPASNPRNFLNGGKCPCCGGTGISPSTQGGTFDAQQKDTLVTALLKEKIVQLSQLEQQLGLGGSEIVTVSKHKIETIGLVMNDFPSIRVDPVGKINPNEVRVLPAGVITNLKASPLIELVHVDDLPGGSYNLNVCNRYNLLVGAGGVSIKSYGTVDVGGTVVNVAGEQVNIASENEVNIVGEKRLTITSESIVLRHKTYGQVLVDSNLGVTQNVVIGGSMHVEGELSVQHVTAPAEVQETYYTELVGWIEHAEINAKLRDSQSGECYIQGPLPLKVKLLPHSHNFLNLPLRLTKTADGTRKAGEQCMQTIRTPAQPVLNAKKSATDPD